MSPMRTVALASCCALAVWLVAACSGGGGGGGGGGTPPQFVVSPTNLSFSAASPNDATPPSQAITATVNGVSSGTLFVRVVVTGPAVTAVDSLVITGPTSGRLSVHVAAPATLGTGSFASVITVTACTTDINCAGPQLTGSPATINVAYQIGNVPPPPDAVAPSVGTANAQGDVVIRGHGFAPGTSVSFGGALATATTFVSATEIHATYPMLAAGTYPISLNNGAIPFAASLQIVDTPAFANATPNATLTYPAVIQSMRGLAYDARHSALFVGANGTSPNNQVWRYTFNGTSWSATPAIVQVGGLRDLTLSLDGTKLLTITNSALVEIDPVSLAAQVPIVPPVPNGVPVFGGILKAIVAANDGQAVVVSGGPNFGQRWLYAIAPRTFTPPGTDDYFHPVAGRPDNGSQVVLVQGGIAPPRTIRQYSASSGLMNTTSVPLAHIPGTPIDDENVNPPVFDRSGSRMIVAFDVPFAAGTGVFDGTNFNELGRLSAGSGTSIGAYALSPDGKRAYTLEIGTGVCRVQAVDLSVTPLPGPGLPFPPSGAPIDLMPDCPTISADKPVRMLLDPPGTTLFIAGERLIRVVTPAP